MIKIIKPKLRDEQPVTNVDLDSIPYVDNFGSLDCVKI